MGDDLQRLAARLRANARTEAEIHRLTLKILADAPDDMPMRECKPMIAQALAARVMLAERSNP